MNPNDLKLIEFCKGKPKTIREISQHLGISVKNVYVKVEKLKKEGVIEVRKSQVIKKVVIQTKQDKENNLELRRLLKIIKENGGEMTYQKLNNKSFEGLSFEQSGITLQTLTQLRFSNLIEQIVKITPEGEKFLKENEK